MFAVAVADFRRKRLLLARDRVGRSHSTCDDGPPPRLRLRAQVAPRRRLVAPGSIPKPSTSTWPSATADPVDRLPRRTKLPPAPRVCDRIGVRVERYWDPSSRAAGSAPSRSDESFAAELEALLVQPSRTASIATSRSAPIPLGRDRSGTIVALDEPGRRRAGAQPHRGFCHRGTDERETPPRGRRARRRPRRDRGPPRPRGRAAAIAAPRRDRSPTRRRSPPGTWSRETRRRVTVALSGDGGDERARHTAPLPHAPPGGARARLPPAGLRRAVLPGLGPRVAPLAALPRPLRAGSVLANLAVDADPRISATAA